MLPYTHFGGVHGESAAIRNTIAFAGITNPATHEPFSEALCFGIAGGIGAGYSFCPSVIKHDGGSGIAIVGRHFSYATSAAWYQAFHDRLGSKTRITETGGAGKALQNLIAELNEGRPAVVWCSRMALPFLGRMQAGVNLWMHSFVVYGIDEEKQIAYGSDRANHSVSLTLDELATARSGVCSHKNRTFTFEPPVSVTIERVRAAVIAGIQATGKEMLSGKMKTFSLPGWEMWAKSITNEKAADGWLKVFATKWMYDALRNVFDSIETTGTGGGLFRGLYADFLDEVSELFGQPAFAEVARQYRTLATEWTALAEAALPDSVKPFKKTKQLLRKKNDTYLAKGDKALSVIHKCDDELFELTREWSNAFPLDGPATRELLEGLRTRIVALHAAEADTIRNLLSLVETTAVAA